MLRCHLSAALPAGGREGRSCVWDKGPGKGCSPVDVAAREGSTGPAGTPSSLTEDGPALEQAATGWVAARGSPFLQILGHKEFLGLIQGVLGGVSTGVGWSVREQWAESSGTSEFSCLVKMVRID